MRWDEDMIPKIQIDVDRQKKRFFAECALCGSRRYAKRLPFGCGKESVLSRLTQRTEEGSRQLRYAKAWTHSYQDLIRHYNYCQSCGSWVCDSCYNVDVDPASCQKCAEKKPAV